MPTYGPWAAGLSFIPELLIRDQVKVVQTYESTDLVLALGRQVNQGDLDSQRGVFLVLAEKDGSGADLVHKDRLRADDLRVDLSLWLLVDGVLTQINAISWHSNQDGANTAFPALALGNEVGQGSVIYKVSVSDTLLHQADLYFGQIPGSNPQN